MTSSTGHLISAPPRTPDGSARAAMLDSGPFWGGEAITQALPGRLGQYRILERLGEGGMGIVFLAEQENPRRRVALKIVKGGFDFPRLLRRLEFEAQVLARLQHEGIAQVIESGVAATDIGPQPFFAMEYVEGHPLTAFAKDRSLSVRERLRLLAEVCQAVHHAHQRGVIHRDLKPGNILVTPEGKPKILDFGVAALTDVGVEAGTLHTHPGNIVGTLPYMSPEQLDDNSKNVDTRADVYALGVIAYEMLSGMTPHDVSGKSVPEAARIIREDEPRPLSRLDRSLRGDVQKLIAKAMDKERERRYPSADAFADDILRYLRDEPIHACGDSAFYVLRKYVRRHRWVAATAVLCVLFITTFAVYAGIQAEAQRRLAKREADAHHLTDEALKTAQAAEQDAQLARTRAESAQRAETRLRRQAESEAQRALAVTDFLVDMIGLADPDMAQTPDRDIQTMLRHASAGVAERFAEQPEAERALRLVIGRAFAALGELEVARTHLDVALRLTRRYYPTDNDKLYEVLWPHFHVLDDLNDVTALNEGYELQGIGRNSIRSRHPDIGMLLDRFTSFMSNNYKEEQAAPVFEKIMTEASAELGPNDPDWLMLADQLYLCGYRLGYRSHPAPAARYLRAALDIQRRRLPETHTRIVRTLGLLVPYSLLAGDAVEAERLARDTLGLLHRVLPDDHWYIAAYEVRHAACLVPLGRFDEAEESLHAAMDRLIASRGKFNTYVGEAHKALISLYDAADRPDDARQERLALARCLDGSPLVPLLTSVSTTWMSSAPPAFGPDQQNLLKAAQTVELEISRNSSRSGAAIDAFLDLRRKTLPDDHPLTAVLADIMTQRAARAVPAVPADLLIRLLQEAYAWDRAASWRHPRKSAQTRWWLVRYLVTEERFAEAEQPAREAVEIMASIPEQDYALLATSNTQYGRVLLGLGRIEEAKQPIEEGYQSLLDANGLTDPNIAAALGACLELRLAKGQPDDASQLAVTHLKRLLDEGAGSPEILDDAAWAVAVHPGLSKAAYQAAFEVSSLSVDMTPTDPYHLNTLGAVQMRLGRFAEAIETLETSNALAKGANAFDPCLIALSLAGMDRSAEACQWLERARSMLPTVRIHNRTIATDLIREAEARLGVSP